MGKTAAVADRSESLLQAIYQDLCAVVYDVYEIAGGPIVKQFENQAELLTDDNFGLPSSCGIRDYDERLPSFVIAERQVGRGFCLSESGVSAV
ncbi:hypothetical protein [Pseudarthrobacter sp. PvP090]|uniref:hypothetical protein n=1 Tax=Pseudarthrobacter sp. PvP090 TaxID=3156393 RepID=UPI00339A606C